MKRSLFCGLLSAAVLLGRGDARSDTAQDAGAAGRRDAVVASVGAAPHVRTVTVGELEDRFASLAPFQRATFGATTDLARKTFLTQILVPEALLAVAADERGLAREPRIAYDLDRVVSNAAIRAIRARIGQASAIPFEDVQKYYDDNRARYDAPERIQVWRILCKTREEAALVLQQAKADPTPKTFGDLAREHSLDKATNLRAGNLGFLTLEGASLEPGLRVDPAVVRAAHGVRDGEVVSAPIPEGDSFAIVWRRGTVAANRRSVEDVAAQIRDSLWKERVKHETDRLLADLRSTKLRDFDPSLVDTIPAPPVDSDAGGIALRRGTRAP
jgi:peptidyl-prolyl cis-trans isomerase C